jgi:hypothetical protein
LVYKLFLPDGFAVLQGLHRGFPFADFALMGAFIVVVIDPKVQIKGLTQIMPKRRYHGKHAEESSKQV